MGRAASRQLREIVLQSMRSAELTLHEVYHLIGAHPCDVVAEPLCGSTDKVFKAVDLARVLDLSLDTLFSHSPAKPNPDLRCVYTLDDHGRITLERTTQGDGPARERVQELRNRGVAAFWTSAFIPEAYL